MNGLFSLAKVALYLLCFPIWTSMRPFLRFSFHQFSDLLSSIRQTLPPTSSSVIIRVCGSFL